jgi:hypothetical protein
MFKFMKDKKRFFHLRNYFTIFFGLNRTCATQNLKKITKLGSKNKKHTCHICRAFVFIFGYVYFIIKTMTIDIQRKLETPKKDCIYCMQTLFENIFGIFLYLKNFNLTNNKLKMCAWCHELN